MNGAQDMGGMMGFGPVTPEAEHIRFHAAWEKRALAITVAAGATGTWGIDESRHARETLPPAEYLASSYYEIWTKGLEKLLVRHGLVTPAELAERRALTPPGPVRRVLAAAEVPAALTRGAPCDRPASTEARFKAGDGVRTLNINPTGHTRLPRYARARTGMVERVHGVFVFPDTHAHGEGESPRWLYTVRFTGRELWGAAADPALSVSIDAWESYLEPA